MLRMRPALFLVLTLFSVFIASARGGETLFGITYDDKLLRIDSATGATTPVGTMAITNTQAMGIRSYNGELYVLDQGNDQLIVIDPNTAATVRTVAVTGNSNSGQGVFSEGDFAIDAAGNGFYNESNSPFSKV